jgi:2-C-methyl-D-erythritol 4-phosphate cytidylyltransferase/2-C-methyl-D-erythritol 2,4-cyclodiphosphate synthase
VPVRVGQGFDVHPFSDDPTRALVLGGVRFAGERGLAGHSDADVVLHAITDALLGAAGLGDIGEHFPPADSRWTGADSSVFLAHAADFVRSRGAMIDHFDCTIIAEAPKVGPHRAAMRLRIAEIAGLSVDQVSVKATTTEGLGFTGRGEGIAAQAVASIRMGFWAK